LLAAKKLADEAEERRLAELRIKEKNKLAEEKKKMEEILRHDKELRFGKKFDEIEVKKKEETPD